MKVVDGGYGLGLGLVNVDSFVPAVVGFLACLNKSLRPFKA
jgi:hypothetical protein